MLLLFIPPSICSIPFHTHISNFTSIHCLIDLVLNQATLIVFHILAMKYPEDVTFQVTGISFLADQMVQLPILIVFI